MLSEKIFRKPVFVDTATWPKNSLTLYPLRGGFCDITLWVYVGLWLLWPRAWWEWHCDFQSWANRWCNFFPVTPLFGTLSCCHVRTLTTPGLPYCEEAKSYGQATAGSCQQSSSLSHPSLGECEWISLFMVLVCRLQVFPGEASVNMERILT